ncbi:cytochrome c [Carnimonas nigrificans]|uniref:cytochrome c n=1 Tax=Carnimonas nigrificans TaxID=64323 RepID=UPI000472D3A6|nr:cytochrome c [Carnimonas nigrificans]
MNKLLMTLLGGSLALTAATSASAAGSEDGYGISTDYDTVQKGRYIATLGDCAACHTKEGGKPLAGGVALATPFGKLVAPNITPDKATGIGNWNFQQFKSAMTEGKAPVGHLYGAMPYTAYTKVSDEDLRAMWSYLHTVEPVENDIVANQLPFPFNIRMSLIGWNLINFNQGEFKPDPKKSDEWNRGAYIVEGLGHCGTCHTPKNLIGGDKNSQFLKASVLENWTVPDISPDNHKGIGEWSKQDLVDYLRDGKNKFDIASGPMAEEVTNSSQYWTEKDLQAVATYLKEGSDGDHQTTPPEPIASDDNRMQPGGQIYADRCAGCHTPDGKGVEGLFPRLANNSLMRQDDPTSLIRVVLAGSRAGSTDAAPTGPSMPAFGWNMSDEQIANVLTFVRNSWGNAANAVSPSDVAKLRDSMKND